MSGNKITKFTCSSSAARERRRTAVFAGYHRLRPKHSRIRFLAHAANHARRRATREKSRNVRMESGLFPGTLRNTFRGPRKSPEKSAEKLSGSQVFGSFEKSDADRGPLCC